MRFFLSLFFFGLLSSLPVAAQNVIRVERAGAESATIDLTGFASDAEGRLFFDTLRRNVRLTSYFREAPPSSAEFAVSGDARGAGGQVSVTIRVIDRAGGRQRYGKQFTVANNQAAQLGRIVADELVQSIHNRPGFATARLVMVGAQPGAKGKEIFAVYPDGGDLIQLTRDRAHVLAPRWAPDGRSITYTSYHRGFPDVYRHHLSPARREVIANFAGINTGGALSPDGRLSALVLSKDGRPELYVRDLGTGRLTRLTTTPNSPKSSPSWSPDGRQIVFVSGHEGRPHLYTVSRDGGAPRRISRGGSENLSPDWGANGWIAYTRKAGPSYQIAVLNPATGEERMVSPADADYEDPSWAPDGRHLVCSRTAGGQSALYLLDTGGGASVALITDRGSWYMPNWSKK